MIGMLSFWVLLMVRCFFLVFMIYMVEGVLVMLWMLLRLVCSFLSLWLSSSSFFLVNCELVMFLKLIFLSFFMCCMCLEMVEKLVSMLLS